jgi:hypothetical protein
MELTTVISNFVVPNFGKIELPLLDIKKALIFVILKTKKMRAIVKHQKKVFMMEMYLLLKKCFWAHTNC